MRVGTGVFHNRDNWGGYFGGKLWRKNHTSLPGDLQYPVDHIGLPGNHEYRYTHVIVSIGHVDSLLARFTYRT